MKNYSKSIDTTNYKLNTINVSQTQTGTINNNNNYVSQLSTKPNSIISHKILFETINIVNNSKRNIT
jgi:dissimilatory sulfite reductase (desulfoviridin) alpha/beta subunit